jgi:hypothetical protein
LPTPFGPAKNVTGDANAISPVPIPGTSVKAADVAVEVPQHDISINNRGNIGNPEACPVLKKSHRATCIYLFFSIILV